MIHLVIFSRQVGEVRVMRMRWSRPEGLLGSLCTIVEPGPDGVKGVRPLFVCGLCYDVN